MIQKWLLIVTICFGMSLLYACTAGNDSGNGGNGSAAIHSADHDDGGDGGGGDDGDGGGGGGGGGSTAPSAPTGLTAVAVSSSQVNLTWTDNATNEIKFRIERQTNMGGFARVAVVTANVTAWSDFQTKPANNYTYRVRAVNKTGKSAYSNEATVTTPAPVPTPPQAPSGLSATAASDTTINLTWTDNSNNETGFNLERKTGVGGTYAQIAAPGANVKSFANSGLTASTSYYYRVRASNSSGTSGYSNEASATTQTTLPPPPPPPPPPPDSSYLVLAYNDTGMNVMNQTYDTLMISPPNNTLRAQVIQRGDPPQLVTAGVSIDYSIPGNTHSSDKVNFWSNAVPLLSRSLAVDTGITGNKLSGAMVYAGGGYWNAIGIPVTPKMDNGTMNAYPLATVTVKTTSNNQVVATTQTPVAVSWEMNCASCHSLPSVISLHGLNGKGGTSGVKMVGDCKICHPNGTGSWRTSLPTPIFCGRCHPQATLQSIAKGYTAYPPLSRAIHGSHASRTTDCSSCHPGQTDKYSRDVHFSAGLTCDSCHGNMTTVAGATRQPWVSEPKCSSCHAVAGHTYEQAGKLFKDSLGHHGVTCAACHGAPHAIGPSTVDADNAQPMFQQGAAGVINQCTVCHVTPPTATFNHTY